MVNLHPTQVSALSGSPSYEASGLWKNAHLQTMAQTLFRTPAVLNYERETIETCDGDFLCLDWLKGGNKRSIVVSHGLEGSSQGIYANRLANYFHERGWDVLCWNMRSCGGAINRRLYSYHSGKTEDLLQVIEHVVDAGRYTEVSLVGFSIGGNLTLKFLGEYAGSFARIVRGAACLSVPCHLGASAARLRERQNVIYMQRFLHRFFSKLSQKQLLYPGALSIRGRWQTTNFHQFDSRYTAPMNGYRTVDEYWEEASCAHSLESIQTPTLLTSAKDDPLLGAGCFPSVESPSVHTIYTDFGGHVGFWSPGDETAWYEPLFERFLAKPESFFSNDRFSDEVVTNP